MLKGIHVAAIALGLSYGAIPAVAVDGVIEINAVLASVGGVTPGDSAGYPITISEPGSYRLTGNLRAADVILGANAPSAITVTSNDVTIDLNGFTIYCESRPATINPPFVGTTCAGDGDGISASGRSGITVKNGSIRNMGRYGVNIGNGGGFVTQVYVTQNDDGGIRCGSSAIVSDNRVFVNGGFGIECGSTSRIANNAVQDNGGNGINATFGTLVTGNAIRDNDGIGLNAASGSAGYSNNTITTNHGGNVSGGTDLGGNLK